MRNLLINVGYHYAYFGYLDDLETRVMRATWGILDAPPIS